MKSLKVSDTAYKRLKKIKERKQEEIGRSVPFSEVVEELLENEDL